MVLVGATRGLGYGCTGGAILSLCADETLESHTAVKNAIRGGIVGFVGGGAIGLGVTIDNARPKPYYRGFFRPRPPNDTEL